MAIKELDLAFEGTTVHCYEGGKGYPILMIHGSGPGTASMSNFRYVMEPLAKRYHVIAMDLIGYGLSGRKKREPYFDTGMWVRQGRFVLDKLAKGRRAGIVGHSLGGYIALRIASGLPRVDKVLAQGSLGARVKMNKGIAIAWRHPRNEAGFRRLYKYVMLNPGELSDAFVRERMALISKDNYREYFDRMYEGGGTRQLGQTVLTPLELKRLQNRRITLIHGAQDLSVPFEEAALALGRKLPNADIVRLANCGHPCSFDQPEKFLQVARNLFG